MVKNSAKNRVRIYQSASSSECLVVDRTDPKPPPAIAGCLILCDSCSSRLPMGRDEQNIKYLSGSGAQ
jgi:hypothetical protein